MPPAANPSLDNFVRGRGRKTQAGRDPMPPPRTPAHPPAAPEPDGAALVPAHPAIPDPHPPYSDDPELTEAEAAELAACEDAIREQQLHFVWSVGRALHVISQGRLYRASHDRFEDYLLANWDGISPPRAYQLMAAWPIAQKLAKGGTVDMRRVNEGQLRALAPVTKYHGTDGAVMVYTTVTETAAEIDGAKVTAKVISTVAGTLPPDGLDRDEVADQARRALTAAEAPPPAGRPWTTTRDSALRAVRQVADAAAGPAEKREALTEMRGIIDEKLAALTDDPDTSEAG
ncbi:MAG: hypothetical protein ACRDN0_40520 [Trebonia sp.]